MAESCSVFFSNTEIFDAKKTAIEAYETSIYIDQVNISNSYQPFYLNDNIKCKATNLKY